MTSVGGLTQAGRDRVSGEYEIRAGEYTALVTAHGAALRRLTFRGRDLIVPTAPAQPIPDYRGIVAAPWPNRIADGFYRFDGHYFHVPINEPERGCALHGLVLNRAWTVSSVDERGIRFALELDPGEGYPSALQLEVAYALDDGDSSPESGLTWGVRARNSGQSPAPYGVCPHPYLVAGDSPLDEWELEIPAGRFLEVTPDRLLPVAERDVESHPFDFRQARPIGATEIDHAFTSIRFGDSGVARVAVRDRAHGTGVGMAWDRSCPWLQVHTADKVAPIPSRLGLAVEPMTCPPDAFNSGVDLIRLEPSATHEARWRIYGIAD
ncbi:aldose 1-epimerase family protein [Sinomonas sp.]|uniref:aldose 1-epimerase family protein n=1 Tax=Sinomonas sp. TaxID=1914986 RepID=UPI003F7EFDCF